LVAEGPAELEARGTQVLSRHLNLLQMVDLVQLLRLQPQAGGRRWQQQLEARVGRVIAMAIMILRGEATVVEGVLGGIQVVMVGPGHNFRGPYAKLYLKNLRWVVVGAGRKARVQIRKQGCL